MIRRDFLSTFLKSSFLFTAANVFGKSTIYEKSANYPQNEILGIDQPPFCGEFMLRCETAEAFAAMSEAAEKDGLKLWCTSGYRGFDYQKNLWNHKYKSFSKSIHTKADIIAEIIKYTSLPGTSRHHWGTDLDITDALGYANENSLSVENYAAGGEYQYLKYWLDKHAAGFGFYEVYTNAVNRTGFNYEPWHYSYAPVAKNMLASLLDIRLSDIIELKKCLGYEYFSQNFLDNYTKRYLLGINPLLIP